MTVVKGYFAGSNLKQEFDKLTDWSIMHPSAPAISSLTKSGNQHNYILKLEVVLTFRAMVDYLPQNFTVRHI